ncbi:hypothetical protein QYG89_01175 [Bacillus sp. B190/17]|uniref:Macro domain-containing protein n=1 Tax=Bacillus lumedeiriae TaxID=3058829 RepID=A0ABW8I4F0_9BACI
MQSTVFRILVMYVSGEEVIAGVFDNQTAVFEQTLRMERKPLSYQPIIQMCTNVLASLDEEGINVWKLQAVCVPHSIEGGTGGQEEMERNQAAIRCGMDMARCMSDRLNIPAYFAVPGCLSEADHEQAVYPGDPSLLYLAKQALFMLEDDY